MPGCPGRMLARLKGLLDAAEALCQQLNEATPDRYQVPTNLPFFESCDWAEQDRPFIHQTWVDASLGLSGLRVALQELVLVFEEKVGKSDGAAGREAADEADVASADNGASIANEAGDREVLPVGSCEPPGAP